MVGCHMKLPVFGTVGLVLTLLAGGCVSQRGELWTIECLEVRGPEREETVETVAGVLRETSGIRPQDVSVIHETEGSRIMYGQYHRDLESATGNRDIPRRLRDDLAMLKALHDDRGRRLFVAARMVPMPVPDTGPPEWNLVNVTGVYTLQIGVFFATADLRDFKSAAVEYVKALRAKGYEAYYYHTDSKSVVTVGVFGEDAVVRSGGHVDYSREVRELQKSEAFAYNITNGAIWKARVDNTEAPVRSLLVKIPRVDGENE